MTEPGVPRETHQEDSPSPDKNACLNNDQHREENTAIADAVALPTATKREEATIPTDHPQNPGDDKPPTKHSPRDYKRRHDCCMVTANIVIAVATTAYVFVALFQWSAMRNQLAQMKADSESGSTAMTDQLGIMSKQVGMMGEQLKQMKDDSLLDSRPWAGQTGANVEPNEVGQLRGLRVVFTNTGKTPAHKFRIHQDIVYIRPDCNVISIAMPQEDENIYRPVSITPLPPGGLGTPIVRVIDKIQIESIMRGEKVAFVFGIARYDDHLRKPHSTRYCYFFDRSSKRWKIHNQYNDMD